MLTELTVKNFALLKELKVELGEGLNILTGATGAGKSILVGAIGFLLGGRAGRHMIRQGTASATVEGVFDLSSREALVDKLEDLGLTPDGGLLILKRQISGKGDSRAYANGSRLTLAQLKRVGDLLIDLHGQHDHQSLLHTGQHLALLDDYGSLQTLRDQVAGEHRRLMTLHQELQDLTETIQERKERQELFQFQLREIEQVQPEEGEDENLERERKILENVESLFEGINSAYHNLFEEDSSIVQRLSSVRQTLERLGHTDAALGKSGQECAALVYQLEDLSASLRQYARGLRRDPERLAVVQERLQDLQRLRRKYGGSIPAVLRYKAELAGKLDSLASGDERQEQLRQELSASVQRFSQSCSRLSSARKEMAIKLQREVESELALLGMPKTRFAVQIKQVEDEAGWIQLSGRKFHADATGMDGVEFLIAPNPGEGLRPLAKIASGGEISRIMLAMKAILAQADQVPLLVFDEIDVGIGGEVAEAVGLALRSLVRSHQVLCITHLHQIASLADEHLCVRKQQRGGRTETVIKKLSAPERVEEVARMMGGEKITQITLDHAQEMIQEGEKPEASLG
jgi:DNA repair protein RecN (Recombination protein N)